MQYGGTSLRNQNFKFIKAAVFFTFYLPNHGKRFATTIIIAVPTHLFESLTWALNVCFIQVTCCHFDKEGHNPNSWDWGTGKSLPQIKENKIFSLSNNYAVFGMSTTRGQCSCTIYTLSKLTWINKSALCQVTDTIVTNIYFPIFTFMFTICMLRTKLKRHLTVEVMFVSLSYIFVALCFLHFNIHSLWGNMTEMLLRHMSYCCQL